MIGGKVKENEIIKKKINFKTISNKINKKIKKQGSNMINEKN
jgi:hypothetical protein